MGWAGALLTATLELPALGVSVLWGSRCGVDSPVAESPRPPARPPAPPQVPRVDDALQPVVSIVPLQMLSYHLTLLRGYNVDQPRNLAKSVTVTEE